MRHSPNRYPRPIAPPRETLQLDIEIATLKKERDDAIAAIEFTLALAQGEETTEIVGAIEWLRDYVEEKPNAIADLDAWQAARGTP